MKKFTLLMSLLIVIAASSCKKYLNTQPEDFTEPGNFYTTEEQLNTALTGVYDGLGRDGTFGRNLLIELEYGNDVGFYKRTGTTSNTMIYDYDASNTIVDAAWKQLYQTINRANYLLASIDKPVMDEKKRKVIKGEALFIRAFCYFQLVNNWGGVPLILSPTTSGEKVDLARSSDKEVFDQIVKDMKEAQSLVNVFSVKGTPGHVSKTAIQAILARVFLKMAGEPLKDVSKYVDARAWADSVIQSGQHQLNPSFDQIFINQSADKYDLTYKETLWEIEFFGDNVTGTVREGARFANQLFVRNTDEIFGYGYAIIGATATLYKKYAVGDFRRDRTIAPYSYQGDNTSIKVAKATTDNSTRDCGKWRREDEVFLPKGKDNSGTNYPVIRYADVLLMYAEAENEINGLSDDAISKVNQVRRRGYGQLNGTQTVDGDFVKTGTTTAADLKAFIQDERCRELAFEGNRKFDLIRWGIFIQTMKAVGNDITLNAATSVKYGALGYTQVSARHLLLPIPLSEISLNNKMSQNNLW